MPKKIGHNTDDYRMLTCRVEKTVMQRLTKLAGARQTEHGLSVSISDVIRSALSDYLRKHEA